MEHKPLDDIMRVARAVPVETQVPRRPMSRRERLERWAEVLEAHGGPVRPLMHIEYLTEEERMRLRGECTPLTVAFNDPVLRQEGLAGDRYGDALTFFQVSEYEAHHMLCDCHYGGTMTATGVAARVRATADRITVRERWERATTAIGWR